MVLPLVVRREKKSGGRRLRKAANISQAIHNGQSIDATFPTSAIKSLPKHMSRFLNAVAVHSIESGAILAASSESSLLMTKIADVIVLGAGIVGVSVALYLQKAGRRVLLVDRREPGCGASYGNAGIIQSEAVMPHLFPQHLRDILYYARNRSAESHYHWSALPGLIKPFLTYWRNSHPDRVAGIARARAPLIRRSIPDHLELATEAGALDLLRHKGWTQIYRKDEAFATALAGVKAFAPEFAIPFVALDGAALAAHEPRLRDGLAGGIHWPQPISVVDPHALTTAYVGLFVRLGGEVHKGDARSLARRHGGWHVSASGHDLRAPEIVVAMGMSSLQLTRKFGYAPPLFAKRGYHTHFAMPAGDGLNRPILDVEFGYVLAPMRRGVRLTTGAEFAKPDAAQTPVQLARTTPPAHELVPTLGDALDTRPWLDSRPCLPDMLPVIGQAPKHPNAWFAFGHAHQGLTLGPTTGRLLAQMMTAAKPFTDPAPYRPERFG